MKHSLQDWLPPAPDFELFHIYCHNKDYRLCWAMNEVFRFELKRTRDFLDPIKGKDETEEEKWKRLKTITYSQFHFEDETAQREIYLISNQPVIRDIEAELEEEGDKMSDEMREMEAAVNVRQERTELFTTKKLELLIPERPRVDYFFQLYGAFEQRALTEIEDQLNLIPVINAAQRVNPESLKSYQNLMH